MVAFMTSIRVRTVVAAGLTAALAVAQFQPGAGAVLARGTVFTANEAGASVSALNLSAGQVHTIAIPVHPHNVQVSPDGRQLFVTGTSAAMSAGSMEGMETGHLLIYDIAHLSTGPAADVAVGNHPAHVIVDPQERYAFVTLSGDNAVAVVDLATRAIVKRIATGAFPHGERFSPNGRVLYTANLEGASITAIDTVALRAIDTVHVGRRPVQVAVAAGGSVFVSLAGEDAVAVVNPRTRQVIAKIAVGRNPAQTYYDTAQNEVLVANQGSVRVPGKTVSVIDAANGHVVHQIEVPDGPHGIAEDAPAHLAFVTSAFADAVTVIDLRTNRVVATYHVGAAPNGVTYSPSSTAP